VRNSVEGFIRNYSATYSQFGLDQSRLWPAGTLCIMIAANIAETGILAFPACFPDSVVGFLADEPGIVRWVELFLRTEKQRLSAYAPATAQKNINLEILRNLSVPIPPPEKLKETIATVDEVLSVTQTAESSINRNLAHAARLRYAILAKAFSGQLVYQDPDDEPASVLLERIRNQRAKQKPQTRSPRPRKRGAPAAQLTLQD